MKKLFDTSAIINLIQTLADDAVPILTNQYILDLSFYEAGNVVWKLHYRKLISSEDAMILLSRLQNIWHNMEVIIFNPLTLQIIYRLAENYNLSFYDASFLHHSVNLNAILITDDKKLQNKIPKRYSWKSSIEL